MRIIKVPIPRCYGTIVPNILSLKRRETPLLNRDECIAFICLISWHVYNIATLSKISSILAIMNAERDNPSEQITPVKRTPQKQLYFELRWF